MFTGIIEEVGEIRSIIPSGSGLRLTFSAQRVLDDVELGSSIAVNGCCLTVVDFGIDWWASDAVPETMDKTGLGTLADGDHVNLERPLRASDRLGGHIVQGHIDGTTNIQSIYKQDDDSYRFTFALDSDWGKYVCLKGSIAIDGISLTVAKGRTDSFEIAGIPHTWSVTNLSQRTTGNLVNVEVDILAKYVERQLSVNESNKLEVR